MLHHSVPSSKQSVHSLILYICHLKHSHFEFFKTAILKNILTFDPEA